MLFLLGAAEADLHHRGHLADAPQRAGVVVGRVQVLVAHVGVGVEGEDGEPGDALRVGARGADGDRVLAAEGDDELAVVHQLADDLLDALDHGLGVAGVDGDFGQRVDPGQVRLAADADVVQLHVAGAVDDGGRALAGADPAGGGGVVRHGEDDDARAVVVAVLRREPGEVLVGEKRSSGFMAIGDLQLAIGIRPIAGCRFQISRLPGLLLRQSQFNCGRLRALMASCERSARALTMRGMPMVASTLAVTKRASGEILRQDCASSNVQPERPPHCGWSIVIWMP